MVRLLMILAVALPTPAAADCLAAATRMTSALEVEIAVDSTIDIAKRLQDPAERQALIEELADQMADEDPAGCAFVLMLSDGAVAAMARAMVARRSGG